LSQDVRCEQSRPPGIEPVDHSAASEYDENDGAKNRLHNPEPGLGNRVVSSFSMRLKRNVPYEWPRHDIAMLANMTDLAPRKPQLDPGRGDEGAQK
jgi:hypothetical protein